MDKNGIGLAINLKHIIDLKTKSHCTENNFQSQMLTEAN
jgi:hypothetical protein